MFNALRQGCIIMIMKQCNVQTNKYDLPLTMCRIIVHIMNSTEEIETKTRFSLDVYDAIGRIWWYDYLRYTYSWNMTTVGNVYTTKPIK